MNTYMDIYMELKVLVGIIQDMFYTSFGRGLGVCGQGVVQIWLGQLTPS
jgi:hypothetical protein